MSIGHSSIATEPDGRDRSRSVTDVTCVACGCLCDDLMVTLADDRVTEVVSACSIGRDWFLSRAIESEVAAAMVEGRPVAAEEAIDRATEILARSIAPVIWGLTESVSETVRSVMKLADERGAKVILARSENDLGRVAAFQDLGRVTATLGEVKNRADVVVYWGCDPLTTHPRHWERYSVEPKGRFVPEGRAGRRVIVVDDEEKASSKAADIFVKIPAQAQVDALVALRMLSRGQPIPVDFPNRTELMGLVSHLKSARYGAFFFNPIRGTGARSVDAWSAAIRLVRQLNEVTRFVLLGMGRAGNLAGAEAVLTWQGGFLQGVDFRRGYPSSLDVSTSLQEVLARREVDMVVAVASGWPSDLPDEARAFLGSIPTVMIGPRATEVSNPTPTVSLATTTMGLDARGTVVRSDGVSLPLRRLRVPKKPDDGVVLETLVARLRERGERPS